MSDLDELYQTLILDHNRSPRNFREITSASGEAEGRNPLCGDVFTVGLKVEEGVVTDAAFLGQGCAISKASASMMTTAVKGKSVREARDLFHRFHEVVTGKIPADEPERAAVRKTLGCLSAFSGVSAFPIRVKCATLAWHAMIAALDRAAADENRTTSHEQE
jgi:nitrogen fixation protein NifU and related proteins